MLGGALRLPQGDFNSISLNNSNLVHNRESPFAN